MTPRERAEQLQRLHTAPDLLVLVNVWDAASARVAAGVPGCRALATASWSIAAAHGVGDGERLERDAMLAAVARIASAVEVPVTADLERGYGDTPSEVQETVVGAIDAGAVGCNLEDGTADPEAPLRPAVEHAERVAAARAAGERAGVPVVVNARTDVFLRVGGAPEERLEAALERGRAYREAGADCIFVPGVADPAVIEALVAGLEAPLSVLAGPSSPSLPELQRLGVARVSFGPGTLAVAMAALQKAAAGLLALEPLPPELGFRP